MNGTTTHPSSEALDVLSQIIRDVVRARRLSPEDGDDFTQSVHLRLLERDYDVFHKFTGQSSLRTYLSVVVTRMLLDWRNARWGKWRTSAAARRLGDAAVALERLIHRDGFTSDEAIELVAATRHAPPLEELRGLAGQLPARMRRQMVCADDLHETLGTEFDDPLAAAEQRQAQAQLRRTLRTAVRRLSPDDQRLVQLRYQEGRSVQSLSRTLQTDPKTLYRRFERVRRTLRRSILSPRQPPVQAPRAAHARP